MAYMGVIMNLKSSLPDERFLTARPLALEGSLFGMHFHVSLEVSLSEESFLTLIAFEWPPSPFISSVKI